MAGFWSLVKLRHGAKQWRACGQRGRETRQRGQSYLALQQPSSRHYSTPVCIQALINANHQTSLPIVCNTKIMRTKPGRTDSHSPGELPSVSCNMLMLKMCVTGEISRPEPLQTLQTKVITITNYQATVRI